MSSVQGTVPESQTADLSSRARSHVSWDELVVENVSLTFNKGRANEYRALENVTMKVRRGEFYCLLGPSGCGKSTILNLIAGFAQPDSGIIRMDQQKIVD